MTAVAVVCLLAVSCSGEEGDAVETPARTGTPAPEARTSATVTAPPLVTPSPDATPLPPREVMKAFWLLDTESHSVLTLLESPVSQYFGGFDAAGDQVFVWSNEADVQIEFDLAGNEVSRGPPPETASLCQTSEPVTIDGLTHPTYECQDREGWAPFPSPGRPRQHYVFDQPSPDGRWHVYQVQIDLPPQAGSGSSYALWALNLETGERRQLYEPLWHCGGCDGDVETGWSPSGRYYVHVERGQARHVLLIDFADGSVTDITWSNGFGFTGTSWSPVADVLLRTAGPNALAIADLATGTEHIVPGVEWGAEFDATGRYVIARSASGNLTAIDVATGQVAREFAGERENSDSAPIVLTPDGLIAVTGRVDGCEGLLVQLETTELGCVEGAESSSISPDGSKVAMTRIAAASEALRRTTQSKEYEIVLFDVVSGEEAVVATGAWSGYAPRLTWNVTSTHLLIEWPVHRGL
jgi:hypothetical protein